MITMRKSTHGFPFVSHIWVAYGAPLGGPSSRWSSAKNEIIIKILIRTRSETYPKIENSPGKTRLQKSHIAEHWTRQNVP